MKKSKFFQIAAILDREKNCRDIKMNRSIAAATPIAAPDHDLHMNIRSRFGDPYNQ